MPVFSDDDVIDFMVREAVMVRGLAARRDAEKAAKRAQWKNGPVGSGME